VDDLVHVRGSLHQIATRHGVSRALLSIMAREEMTDEQREHRRATIADGRRARLAQRLSREQDRRRAAAERRRRTLARPMPGLHTLSLEYQQLAMRRSRGESLADIAREVGLTRERVRQIYEQACAPPRPKRARGRTSRREALAYIAGALDARGVRPPLRRLRVTGMAADAVAAYLDMPAPASGLDITDSRRLQRITDLMASCSRCSEWRA
jgi:hypothetical protein